MNGKPLVFRQHAIKRMFERSITSSDVDTVLFSGQRIEDYPLDMPYPSALWLGFSKDRPLHVVAAETPEEQIIITVYEPDPAQWGSDWKTRIKS